MDSTGSYQWYYYSMNNRSPAWSGVDFLRTYLINNDYIGPQGNLANSTQILYSMKIGDPVFIDFNHDGSYDHAVSITKYQSGFSSYTAVAAHTRNRLNYPLINYSGAKSYVMLTGYGEQ